jgi:hypothetical protein
VEDIREQNGIQSTQLSATTRRNAIRAGGIRATNSYQAQPLSTCRIICNVLLCRKPCENSKVLVRELVEHSRFDLFCGTVILANAVLIGWETDYIANHDGATRVHFQTVGFAMNLWYVLEILLRLLTYGKDFFLGPDYRWNVFDTVLISTSLLDLAFEAISFGKQTLVAARIARITRLFRVMRLLRVMRMLRYVREFRKLVFSLASSLQTLFWSLLLLFFVMFCFGVFFTQSVSDYNRTAEESETSIMKVHFGSLPRSMYSLYLAVTNGKAWGDLLGSMMKINWFVTVVFIIYMSMTLFGLLNVITAVFVESAMQSSQYYKDLMVEDKLVTEQVCSRHMKQIFKDIDKDDSGTISLEEMNGFLEDEALDLATYFEALGITPTEAKMLFVLLDRDRSGLVDVDEFCDGCMRLRGTAKSFDLNALHHDLKRLYAQSLNFFTHMTRQTKTDLTRQINFETRTGKELSHIKKGLAELTMRLCGTEQLQSSVVSVHQESSRPPLRFGGRDSI